MYIRYDTIDRVLDSMYWTFSPYLPVENLDDVPWIRSLIINYNNLLELIDAEGIPHYRDYIEL